MPIRTYANQLNVVVSRLMRRRLFAAGCTTGRFKLRRLTYMRSSRLNSLKSTGSAQYWILQVAVVAGHRDDPDDDRCRLS